MLNIKYCLAFIIFAFSCTKEKGKIIEEKKNNVSIVINSQGPISEYKIINSITKKVLIQNANPKPTSVRPGNGFNYATYNEYLDLASQEKLTIQVPVKENLKRFGLNVGGNHFSELREDKKLNIYYIDFEAPKQL